MELTLKSITTLVIRALTSAATLLMVGGMAGGVISGWFAIILTLALGIVAGDFVGDWWVDTGYDVAIKGARGIAAFFRKAAAPAAAE